MLRPRRLFSGKMSAQIKSFNGPITGNKIILEKTGGVEVLEYKQVEFPVPTEAEARVQIKAIGLNYIETYGRSGIYPLKFPSGLGTEASGIVESVGKAVSNVKVGDRVTFAIGGSGSYAEYTLIPASNLVKLPESISFEQAAAVTLKGLTCQFLIKQLKDLKKGDIVVFWAAAGGVGLIALQWLKSLGVKVIAITSSDEKIKLAEEFGAWKTINHKTDNIREKVLEYTDNKKVPVVFDSIGKATFETSLDLIQPRGLMVSYGNASGPVTGVSLGILAQKGSLFVTRPTLYGYADTPENLQMMADDLFHAISSGAVKVNINQRYTLKNVAQAHLDLEAGKTTGSSIIIP